MSKIGDMISSFGRNFFYSYLLGPYMARYIMDKEKYSFLSQPDPYYAVVTDRKSIAKFQAKHGALGVLSDTKKNLIIRELVKDKSDGKCYSVERCISHVENEAVFIPVFNGRVVVYSLYRYPQHQYCYEFLRSCQNIKENTPKELFSSFSMCSGIEINLINDITCLGSICPDSTQTHRRIAVYVVDLKCFDFNSLEPNKRSFDFVSDFNRKFNEAVFLTLSEVSEYIQNEKIVDGITLSAFSLLISSLIKKSPDLYKKLVTANKEGSSVLDEQ